LFAWDSKVGAKSYRVQVSSRADFGQLVETATTDTTRFAPKLSQYGYQAGGTLYWRVAAVDADGNVGKFTAARTFSRPKALRVSALGTPLHRRRVTVTVTVATLLSRPVGGATVRVTGAGTGVHTRTTNRLGRASFRIRATRWGDVTVRVTKSGYRTTTLLLAVH
jgi:hypothetical protein